MSRQWREQRERGSTQLIRFLIWLALRCGRNASRVLLLPFIAYFLLAAPLARRSSQVFMRRALGRPASLRETFMHFFAFGTTLLDRIYLVNGRHRELVVERRNESVFWDALATGRGCLLLGAHLGSFEMLGVIGGVEKKLPINIVMHVEGGVQFRDLLPRSGNAPPYNVIPLGEPGSMLRVKECLERGEIVGILADRIYGGERTQPMPFLGRTARFSMSPMRLATIAGAPVVAVFGLFHGGRRYEIVFDKLLGDEQPGTHAAPATQLLSRYVANLERQARQTPGNWFNFYDYWNA